MSSAMTHSSDTYTGQVLSEVAAETTYAIMSATTRIMGIPIIR